VIEPVRGGLPKRRGSRSSRSTSVKLLPGDDGENSGVGDDGDDNDAGEDGEDDDGDGMVAAVLAAVMVVFAFFAVLAIFAAGGRFARAAAKGCAVSTSLKRDAFTRRAAPGCGSDDDDDQVTTRPPGAHGESWHQGE